MKKIVLLVCLLAVRIMTVHAQDTVSAARITPEEYNKAKTFSVSDLDKDTYVKFENAYILDKNDFGKPYFITGDDGLKKRIDLYKLIRKEGRIEIGTVIFYTTETNKRYVACLPGFKADGKVWEKYFEDIHAIDKEEKNFVLKLSYVLSKELGFQLYRAANTTGGASRERESGTYGNDICFPGNTLVTMADGRQQMLRDVKAGDNIVTVDPATRRSAVVRVKELTEHAAKNYAITSLLLMSAEELPSAAGIETRLKAVRLQATPNHPMVTATGNKKIGELKEGDEVLCLDNATGKYRRYKVFDKEEAAGGTQRVYNIVAAGGSTFVVNGVMVSQK